ncbi:histidine phosphatase family protein [Clostridioides mangenotii]|uniref:histidine phosphatase family protein n=1 Tax=Metaclostridioides mangenotii TaxID=1540 RepID=UPI001C1222BA|nr:histidine phosphatase family protein [Clostridioides mangenotii]MBU5306226.1 histidine phosphatase family protein [Clostridioides mangenotii]
MGNTFYIVRHGQTNWNIQGKTQGHGNSDLTESGESQAKQLAESLVNRNIDYIYSSDLGRAVQTAELIGNKLGLKVEMTEGLREMGFGVWEGLLIKEIQKDYADTYKTWRDEPHMVNIPGGETLHIIKQRVDKFIEEINEKYDNKNIVLVTHSITLRVMLLSFLNSGMENIYRIKQDNTALNIVEFKEYGPVVEKMNDTRHLIKDEKISNSALE